MSEEKKPLPDQVKHDNWQLYVLSRSNDPTVMIPNTRKLLSNLVNSAKIIYGVRDIGKIPDRDLARDLIECVTIVNNAWYEYAENKDWGFAMQECEKVLDKIGDLLYNPEWSIGKKDSFTSSGMVKK